MSADTAPAESAAVRGWETQLYNAGMWQPCHYSSFPDYQLTDWVLLDVLHTLSYNTDHPPSHP